MREGRPVLNVLEQDLQSFHDIIKFGGVPYERKINSRIVTTWKHVDEMIEAMVGVVSGDLETTCLYPWDKGAAIVTIGIGTRDTQWSIFVHHPESTWTEEDIEKILRRIHEASQDCTMVWHNGKFDVLWLYVQYQVLFAIDFDTMLAHYNVDENSLHDLEYLSSLYFSAPKWDIPLKEKQGGAPAEKIAHYHAHDLYYTRNLYFVLKKKLDADPKTNRIFRQITMKCANAFVMIEHRGMFLDKKKMVEAEKYLREQLAIAAEALKRWGDINWGSPQQVGRLLYDELGIRCPMKTKSGADSTAESALKQIDHPCVADLLKFRGHKQQLSFFIDGWKPFIAGSRLHPVFKLHGTVTGRLSSEHPNCQQIPRDPRIRTIIGAPPGWTLVEADLSQIEMRIAGEVSGCRQLIEVFQRGMDVHWNTVLNELERYVGQAEIVCETARVARLLSRAPGFAEAIQILRDIGPEAAADIDPVWKELRKKAKAVNFGYLFGMQWKKFRMYARDNYDMHITDEEAQQSRIAFFETYPLDKWHNRQKAKARIDGFVRSLAGRKRRLPAAQRGDDSFEEGEALRQAINSPVQSFANDINLMVLLQMREEFPATVYQPVATVHDSILQEVRNDYVERVARRITEVMRQPRLFKDFDINLRVPLEGDVKIGPWGAGVSLSRWKASQ